MYTRYLILGATGLTGVELVKQLLNEKKDVAICVRSITKAKELFKSYYEEIKFVVEHELGIGKESKELEETVKWSEIVINTCSAPFGGNPQISDYNSNNEIICVLEKQTTKVKKYVFISTWFSTRPYGYLSIILNLLRNNIFGWKALSENRIRQSNIPYMIVRPARLTNANNIENTSVGVYQDDNKYVGEISRANTAKSIINALDNSLINKGNVTFELLETSNKQTNYLVLSKPIKQDDKNSYITGDHFRAAKIVKVILCFILLFIIYIVFGEKLKLK